MEESEERLGFGLGMAHLQSTPAATGARANGGESSPFSQGTAGVVPIFPYSMVLNPKAKHQFAGNMLNLGTA